MIIDEDEVTVDVNPISFEVFRTNEMCGLKEESKGDNCWEDENSMLERNTTIIPDGNMLVKGKKVEGVSDGNMLVKGKEEKGVKLYQADDDDDQPIPQPTKPEPNKPVINEDNQLVLRQDEPEHGPDNTDRPATPHFEDDPTRNDKYPSLINSSLETPGNPGTNEIPHEKLLLAQPEERSRSKDDEGNEGDGVDETDVAKWATTTTINEERDDAKYNPKKGVNTKSNPLLQLNFDGTQPMLMPMNQYTTLLKGQHTRSLAEITNVKNLPYY